MTLRTWVGLLPPFVLGAVLSVSGSVAFGLLLFQGPGFASALAVVVAVPLAGFGFGLLQGARRLERRSQAEIRRRWLSVTLWVAMAAGFASAWEGFPGLGGGASAQGLGLALLGGLPFYSVGRLLGGMGPTSRGDPSPHPTPPPHPHPEISRVGAHTTEGPAPFPGVLPQEASPPPAGSPAAVAILPVGAVAALGAAAGSLLVGLVLFPIFTPSGLLVLCIPWLLGAGWVDVLLLSAHEGG
jgi:hypothetical protein